MPRTKPADMIGAVEAAKLLGVSSRQVRNLITAGTLPAAKVGRDYVIDRDDVNRIPTDRRRKPKPRAARSHNPSN